MARDNQRDYSQSGPHLLASSWRQELANQRERARLATASGQGNRPGAAGADNVAGAGAGASNNQREERARGRHARSDTPPGPRLNRSRTQPPGRRDNEQGRRSESTPRNNGRGVHRMSHDNDVEMEM